MRPRGHRASDHHHHDHHHDHRGRRKRHKRHRVRRPHCRHRRSPTRWAGHAARTAAVALLGLTAFGAAAHSTRAAESPTAEGVPKGHTSTEGGANHLHHEHLEELRNPGRFRDIRKKLPRSYGTGQGS